MRAVQCPFILLRNKSEFNLVRVVHSHQKGIVNRDLKLENVLLTVDKPNLDKAVVELPNVRLCDFG